MLYISISLSLFFIFSLFVSHKEKLDNKIFSMLYSQAVDIIYMYMCGYHFEYNVKLKQNSADYSSVYGIF